MKIPRLKFKSSLYLALAVSLALGLIVTFSNFSLAQTPLTRNNGASVGDNQTQTAEAKRPASLQLTNRQGQPVYDN